MVLLYVNEMLPGNIPASVCRSARDSADNFRITWFYAGNMIGKVELFQLHRFELGETTIALTSRFLTSSILYILAAAS